VGDGAVEGVDELLPQAVASTRTAETKVRRDKNIRSSAANRVRHAIMIRETGVGGVRRAPSQHPISGRCRIFRLNAELNDQWRRLYGRCTTRVRVLSV
jgi:hypothetical protein